MDKGDPCEICGGTESNLVDGFYYCTECGTQDTNVRETLVEHNMLADGTFAIAHRQKISRKLKEGVKMSAEWYKWHTLNFILAGLTAQLVRLGAAPSLKMKVLWIWTRYIKKFQKNNQMKPTQMFSKLEVSASESEAESGAGSAAAAAGEDQQRAGGVALHRVTRGLLAAVLALALNLDRSELQLSHLLRLVLHRLLNLNDFQSFVPAEIDPADVPDYRWLCAAPLTRCAKLPRAMGRLARRLRLGPPLTPDVEALLAVRLRELRLPPGLATLVRALMHRAPVPFLNPLYFRFKADHDRHPDYEAVVAAYVLVALKMCFGLDDDRERRLSDAVDRLNASAEHPRADGAGRLFSPREWIAHLQFRAAALCAHYAPLAWERNMRADDYVFVEHFEAHAYAGRAGAGAGAGGRGAGEARAVGDRVAMELLRDVPDGRVPDVPPLADVKACMGALAPHAALAEAVAAHARDERTRRLLREDFTRHSADYAYRALALPGADPALFEGVAEAGKTVSAGPDRAHSALRSDPTVVYVRNCENKNWVRTRRPTASHVVGAEEPDAEPDTESDAEPAADDSEERRDEGPETFREEAEDENIFDDDFRVKEEIEIECEPESFHETKDDPESRENYFTNFAGFDENVDREESDTDARGGLAFDSDEERPRYDPAAFDRRETIRKIMFAAYREFPTHSVPAKFAPDGDKRTTRQRAAPGARARGARGAGRPPRDPARAAARRAKHERVQRLVHTYFDNLRHDVLHQVARQVRAFVDDAETRMEATDAASDREPAARGDAARGDASSTDTRDVRVVGDDADDTDDDDAALGPAKDPLSYGGDARFDERAHDARQLYVRLKRAPPPAEPEPPDDPDDRDDRDDRDDEATRLLDEKIADPVPRRRAARAPRDRIDFVKIDHLVDDPQSITKFNYWITHYTPNFKKSADDSNGVQQSFDETLPRSFRFVLRECAAQLHHVPPSLLYRYVMYVEDALLAAARACRPGARAERGRAKRKSEASKENVAARADARGGPAGKRKRKNRVTLRPNTR